MERGETTYTETRWPVAETLRPGDNEIEWTAGNLRSHYWLRAVRLHVEYDRATEVAFPLLEVGDELFPEARFSQCSYNALATVLDHFYGVEGWADDRKAFEDGQFVAALKRYDLEPYFGWAPWTSYMAESGRLRWNGRAVNDLKAERFALSTKEAPHPDGLEMLVHYQPGEKDRLVEVLLSKLGRGPVIIWTPYAGAMGREGDRWHHVRKAGPDTDAVRFSPNVTHSVVVNREAGAVKVYDNSLPNGVFVVGPRPWWPPPPRCRGRSGSTAAAAGRCSGTACAASRRTSSTSASRGDDAGPSSRLGPTGVKSSEACGCNFHSKTWASSSASTGR